MKLSYMFLVEILAGIVNVRNFKNLLSNFQPIIIVHEQNERLIERYREGDIFLKIDQLFCVTKI